MFQKDMDKYFYAFPFINAW